MPFGKRLYSFFRKKNQGLGNGPSGAINGSLTVGSLTDVFMAMERTMNFGKNSVLLDLGAGVGKVLFHAAVMFDVQTIIGIEVEKYRWWTSMFFLEQFLQPATMNSLGIPEYAGKILLLHIDMTSTQLKHFNGVSHIFWFDTGMPPRVKDKVAATANNSVGPLYLVCTLNERMFRDVFEFKGVQLFGPMNVNMTISSEGKQLYGYKIECTKESKRTKVTFLHRKYNRPRHHDLEPSPGGLKSVNYDELRTLVNTSEGVQSRTYREKLKNEVGLGRATRVLRVRKPPTHLPPPLPSRNGRKGKTNNKRKPPVPTRTKSKKKQKNQNNNKEEEEGEGEEEEEEEDQSPPPSPPPPPLAVTHHHTAPWY